MKYHLYLEYEMVFKSGAVRVVWVDELSVKYNFDTLTSYNVKWAPIDEKGAKTAPLFLNWENIDMLQPTGRRNLVKADKDDNIVSMRELPVDRTTDKDDKELVEALKQL